MIWFGLLLILGLRIPRRGVRRRRRTGDSLLDFARLLSVCLSAGLPLTAAMEIAGEEVEVGDEVRDILRKARNLGMARALLTSGGQLSALAGQLARSHLSGAPIQDAVRAFVATRRAEHRFRALETARTLGVKLIVPVALMLLPGFIFLVFGPTVVEEMTGLLGVSQ